MIESALLLIDVQQGFDNEKWGSRNNLDAEENIARLLAHWRAAKAPVIHVQHSSTSVDSPLNPKTKGFAFKEIAQPSDSEPVFVKTVNSAFIGTNLEAYLHDNNLKSLVIVGLTTNHCVSTTTRMAANFGFEVSIVSDATATFDRVGPNGETYSAQLLHDVSLVSLHGEFAKVVSTKSVLLSV
ncbi:UNVERIFIED_CONTAM: hypothetical protein GTU68_065060 [Idotea baltica]|nr:hypothetical protein [Idotea baltica]